MRRCVMGCLIVIGAFFGFSTAVQAQFKGIPLEWQLHVGAGTFRAPSLQRQLQAASAAELPAAGVYLGMGAGYRMGRWIVGANLGSYSGFRKDQRARVTSGTLSVGMHAWYFGRWILTPQVGVGPQFSRTTITKAMENPVFGDYLGALSNQTVLQHTTAIADIALVVKSYELLTARYRTRFKVGYQTGLGSSPWKVGRETAADAPHDRTATFYLQVSLGIGR